MMPFVLVTALTCAAPPPFSRRTSDTATPLRSADTQPPLAPRSHKRAADVRRCHALRASLELFDFDHPSIAFVQRLLLRAAFAPVFLRGAEGRRFVSFLFTLSPGLVRELNPVFRNLTAFGAPPQH